MAGHSRVLIAVPILLATALAFSACRRQDVSKPMARLHAIRGDDPGLFDSLGRQVVLRGTNFNHLGDYFRGHELLPEVADLGEDDWDDAAALGMNVVRLVTSWSAWQPERGSFNRAYLERVREAVSAANAREMYVVIDMHQDAWSRYVFTPADEVCPPGTGHQKGWDGAPLWATFTDGEPTCTPGRREESPAVIRAWDGFHANRAGIRDELAGLWGAIAREFALHPGVAGYDLLNEAGNGSDPETTRQGISAFIRSSIDAIREAEAEVGGPGHVIFFEPSVMGLFPDFDLHPDGNLVFAPHNYAECIGPQDEGLLESLFWVYELVADQYRSTIWVGEYNCFSDAERNHAWLLRYAALEDRLPGAGSTWWQWEQACGDPHSIQYPPTEAWVESQGKRCGNARFPVDPCLYRAYPRAVPGRLRSLSVPDCGAELQLSGETGRPGTADLWVPSDVETAPAVSGDGIDAVNARRVPGGWRVEVAVAGSYTIDVQP